MNLESFLFCIQTDGGEDTSFVVAPSLSAALQKWKQRVADYINEDYESDGVARVITPEDVDDPDSIELIAAPNQLML